MILANFEALSAVILASFVIVSIPSVSTSTLAAALLNLIRLNMALNDGVVVIVEIYTFWVS